MMARRQLAALVALALLAAACTGSGPALPPKTATPKTSGTAALPVTPARADPLCKSPPPPRSSPGKASGSLPPVVAQVARQVQEVRDLTFLHPVPAQPVSSTRMTQLLHSNANAQEPKREAARTSKAWATIGAIPRGTDLYKAVVDFDTSQVIGFYDPETHRLVFIGSSAPTAFQRFTLSHELTHALDDQRFDLTRLDKLQICRDDEQGAYIALAEGDAVVTSVLWAQRNLSPQELRQVDRESRSGPSPPASVPPFLISLLDFPYEAGPRFIQALLEQGGPRAVDNAFRHPPVSTEQILHADRYPLDRPVPVEVPNAGSRLGKRWKEIEIEQVGEAWLQLLFELHLSRSDAAADSDQWGGGQYRAWSDGAHTAVVMDTVWDRPQAASRFVQGMRRWLGGRSTATVLQLAPTSVRVLFASDQRTLTALRRIAG